MNNPNNTNNEMQKTINGIGKTINPNATISKLSIISAISTAIPEISVNTLVPLMIASNSTSNNLINAFFFV